MEEKKILIICFTVIVCVAIISGVLVYINSSNVNQSVNNSSNDSINISLNDSNVTNNTTVSTSSKKSSSKKSSKKGDSDYDASRDASHKYATEDNPVTVQQSDGEYTYYGPGHYDYYAGSNHMSGEYYKHKNYGS